MNEKEFMQYVYDNFDICGAAQRLIANILEYAETLPRESHYTTLTALLDGTIGLTDAEIRQISL